MGQANNLHFGLLTMGRVPETNLQSLEAADRLAGFFALVDSLPVGVIWLGFDGEVHYRNASADRLLSGPYLEQVNDELKRLAAVCADSGGCHATSFDGRNERVTLQLSPGPGGEGYVGVLKVEVVPVVLEVRALHTMLRTMASEPNDAEVAVRALELLQQDTGVSVAFFRHDPPRGVLCCEIARGFSESEPAGAELSVDGYHLVAQAFQAKKVVTSHADRPGDPQLPLFEGPYSTAIAEPVFSSGEAVGVVVAVARSGELKASTLRLLDGICAALAAMAHQRALKRQATHARKVAADRDRLATIGQLVAGVAHEINNPLAFLKSNLHSLKAEVEALGPSAAATLSEVEEIVSESLEGVARIEAIVQALKNTARQRNEASRFDPARAVNEAITIFRGAKKAEAELVCELSPDIPEVMGVASHLGQVVLNLLQNGLDAMGGRGKLEVRGTRSEDGARFEFVDRGTGIPPEVQKKMYDAFFTTKEPGKGTGLGLYLCKEIIERLNGRLEYRTGPGGTTFEVWLPGFRAT